MGAGKRGVSRRPQAGSLSQLTESTPEWDGTAVSVRHENKFTVPAHLRGSIESRLSLLSQGLRQAYAPRYVNSLYYDSAPATRYWDTVEGLGRRNKLRIRWYRSFWGEVDEPALEVKLKAGHAGSKRSFRLAPFELRRSTPRRALRRLLTAAELPHPVPRSGLDVVLATRYRRHYFATFDRRLRITLDDDVRYLRAPGMRGFSAFWRRDPHIVVELKYGVGHRREAEAAAQELGLRWVRNSKFARGLEATGLLGAAGAGGLSA